MDHINFHEHLEHHEKKHPPVNTKEVLVLLALSFLSYLIFYFMNMQLTKYLEPHAYGDFKSAIRIAVFMVVFITFGMSTASNVLLPGYIVEKKKSNTTGLIRWVSKNVLIICSLYITAVLLVHLAILVTQNMAISDLYKIHPSLMMILFTPLLGISYLLAAPILAKHKFVAVSVPSSIIYPLSFLILMGLSYLIGITLDTIPLLIIFIISQTLAVLVTVVLGWREIKQELSSTVDDSEKNRWKELSTTSFFNILNASFYAAMGIMLCEWLCKDEAQVGYFAVLTLLTSIYYTLTSPLNNFGKPQFQELTAEHDMAGLQQLWNKLLLIRLAIVIGLCICQIIFGRALLEHFGPQYAHLYPILVVASVGYSFNYFMAGAPVLLFYTGLHKIQTQIGVAQTILTAILMAIGAYLYGASGVIYAAIGVRFVTFLIMNEVIRRHSIKPYGIF